MDLVAVTAYMDDLLDSGDLLLDVNVNVVVVRISRREGFRRPREQMSHQHQHHQFSNLLTQTPNTLFLHSLQSFQRYLLFKMYATAVFRTLVAAVAALPHHPDVDVDVEKEVGHVCGNGNKVHENGCGVHFE